MTRVFVLLGQGGLATSPGIAALARRLEGAGRTVTTHLWDSNISPLVNDVIGGRAVVIGYSLGGNQIGWIGRFLDRPVKLGIAIDPSMNSPLVRPEMCTENGDTILEYVQTAANFERLICFYRPSARLFGGAKYIGDNVEIVKLPRGPMHLGVQWLPSVWRRIEKEVADVAKV